MKKEVVLSNEARIATDFVKALRRKPAKMVFALRNALSGTPFAFKLLKEGSGLKGVNEWEEWTPRIKGKFPWNTEKK